MNQAQRIQKAEDLISIVAPILLIVFPIVITPWGAVRGSESLGAALAQNSPFAAICFIVLGVALLFFRSVEISLFRRRMVQVLSGLVLLASLVALVGHLHPVASGLLHTALENVAMHLSATIAGSFVLSSVTIGMLTATRWRAHLTLARIGAFAILLISALVVVGYIFGHPRFFQEPHLAEMPLQTALLFIVISVDALRLGRVDPTKMTLGAGFVSIVFIVVVLAGMVEGSIQEAREVQAQLDSTDRITNLVEDVVYTAKDAEASQRGFLITDDESYLEPYRSAAAHHDAQLRQLAALTADNPTQHQNVTRLSHLVDQKYDELHYSIELRRTKGYWASAYEVDTNKGFRLMNQILDQSHVIRQSAQRTLADEQYQQEMSNRHTTAAIIVGTLANALLVAAMYLRMRHENNQRNLADAKLRTEKNDALAARAKSDAILSSIGDGVFALDPKGYIMLFNHAASEITGHDAEDMLGKHYEDALRFCTNDGKRRHDQFIRKALEGVDEKQCTSKLERSDGTLMSVTSTAAPIIETNGTKQGAIVVFREVSSGDEA